MADPLSNLGLNFDLGFLSRFSAMIPLLLIIIGLGIAAYFVIWYSKFRIIVEVHNERNDGSIYIKRTRGGFFMNPFSKVESFKVLNDLRALIKPMPNNMICTLSKVLLRDDLPKDYRKKAEKEMNQEEMNEIARFVQPKDTKKDILYLRKTAHGEYVPMVMKREILYLDNKTMKEKKTFVVYPEFIKGWLAIKYTEIRNKFKYLDFIEKYAVPISLGAIVIIWILTLRFFGDRIDLMMSMASRTAQTVSGAAP